MSLAGAIQLLLDSFPRQQLTDASIRAYGEALTDIDPGLVMEACERLRRTATFLPSIAEIRQECAELHLGLPTVEEAWDMALAGLLHVPEVKQSVNAVGGTWAVNHSDRPDTIRAQFRDNYTGRRRTRLREATQGVRSLPPSVTSLNGRRVAAIPETTSMPIRPVMWRAAQRLAGAEMPEITDADRLDAIRVLELFPHDPGDELYVEAFRIFEEASRPEDKSWLRANNVRQSRAILRSLETSDPTG